MTSVKLPNTIEAVIFDMDGLLFDTERLYAEAMIFIASEMGAILSTDITLRTIGLPVTASQVIWREHFGPQFDVEQFWAASLDKFHSLTATQLSIKQGVIELLDLLDVRRLPRAIATSTARPTVDKHLGISGLSGRFDAIVAHGDYEFGKPHPAPYLTAATKLGVDPSNCLALEDSQNGVRSAAAAGMMTVMVPDLVPATDEMKELAVLIAQDLHEVSRMLECQEYERTCS